MIYIFIAQHLLSQYKMRKNSTAGVLRYNLGTTVDPGLVQQIDAIRGWIPRSRIVEEAIVLYLHHKRGNYGEVIAVEEAQQKGDRGLVHQAEPPTTTSTFKTPTVSGTTTRSPSTATIGAPSTATGVPSALDR